MKVIAARGAEHQRSPIGDRQPHDPAPRLSASQRIRKRIEEAFSWIKTVAGQDKTKFRGRDRVGWAFTFAAAAYTVRPPKLMMETG